MPLNFQNASVLNYNQESQFFGELFRFQNRKTLTVEGLIRDIGNASGVVGILSGVNSFFSNDQDYQNIIINGYNFGNGKIENVNFTEGDDVTLKRYSVNITCYETGNLFNLSGLYYSGIGQSAQNRYDLLDNLTENFSFNRDGQSYGYNHSVSLRMNSGAGLAQSPIALAKSLASSLFASNVPFGFLTSGENQSLGYKTYNETYNEITNECSFSEDYTRPVNNSGFLFTRTNSFQLAENGVASVSENADIENLSGNLDTKVFNSLDVLIDAISSGAYSRCNDVFNRYASSGAYPLYTGYQSFSKNLLHFENKASYSINYTNDIRQTNNCSWEYKIDVNKNGRNYIVSENGNIIGHGIPQTEGILRAKALFPVIKSGCYSRVYSAYVDYANSPIPLKRISESTVNSHFNGSIGYGFTFSDSPIYNEGVSGVKVKKISVNDENPTTLINKFEIFNAKEIVQKQQNSTLGTRNLGLELSLTSDHDFSIIKTYAKNVANQYVPTGENAHIAGLNYTYSPVEKKFNLNVNWNFNAGAELFI